MTSIIKPSPAEKTRRLIVLLAALAAVAVPAVQMGLGLGLSQAAFAAQGDSTLRVAGFAFSIWGLIYIGILIYAVRQVLPQTGESRLIHRLGWPSAAAFTGVALWIVAASMNLQWGTVAIIWATWAAITLPLFALAGEARRQSLWERDRTTVVWPLAALASWLSAAAPLNLITTLTATDSLPPLIPPSIWGMIALVAVAGAGVIGAWVLRSLAFPLPIAWALLGAFVAMQSDGVFAVAYAALALSVLVLLASVVIVFNLRPGVERNRPAG